MKKFILLLCITSYVNAALSPRLLIVMDPKHTVTAQDVANNLEAHILPSNDFDVLKQQINNLDKSSENHRIIIDGSVDKLSDLARRVGYDYLNLNDLNITDTCNAILEKEKTIPVTDASMRRIDEQTAGLLYQLMIEVDAILTEHHLTYWITCGTLLGAVRHRGLIPWDDDLDICMYMHDIKQLLNLKETLQQHGLQISMHKNGWYKIYFKNGKKIKVTEEMKKHFNYQDYFDWTFPAIDIFPVYLNAENKVVHVSKSCKEWWPSEFFLAHELIPPFNYLEFGPLHVPAPRNATDILNRFYGNDWNGITYDLFDHENEKKLKKIKVALTDRSSIPYIFPLNPI